MKWTLIVSIFTLFANYAPARADYIVYEFAGRFERENFSGPVVPIGSEFNILVSFDEFGNRADEKLNGGIQSIYSPVLVEISVGEETVRATAAQVRVRDFDANFNDLLSIRAGLEANAPFSGNLSGNTIRFFSVTLDGFLDTFTTSDYPRSIETSDFHAGGINLLSGPIGSGTLSSSSVYGIVGDQTFNEFEITSARICDTPTCQIPEPRALALAACGLAALIAARSFRRARLPRAC